MGAARTLLVMARWLVSGRCKSRLAAELGPIRAAAAFGLVPYQLACRSDLASWR
jgi:glycosyltransferase A (GT-A) superfamily protein (DUF2064 family)